MRSHLQFSLFLLVAICCALGNAYAQTGIGTISPDPNFALHVKTNAPTQDILRLEGIRGTAVDTNVLVTDINGRVRSRGIYSLINDNSEWRYRPASQQIYAFRAKTSGTNTDIVITDNGRIGIGITTPVAGLHLFQRGLITGSTVSSPAGYDTREQIRLASGSGDAMLVVQDGTGRVNLKWNSSYGAGTFLQTGDYAARMLLHGDANPGAQVFDILQSTAPGVAGGNITWASRFRISNEGVVTINPNTIATGLLDVNSRTRIRNLPVGLFNDDPINSDQILTADASGNVRKVSAALFNQTAGEWANHSSNNYIYARRAKDQPPFHDVVVSTEGEIGLGLTNPLDKIHLRDGGIRFQNGSAGRYGYGLSFGNETTYEGVGTTDGARFYTDRDAFGGSRDAIIFEKTDFNHSVVDGGFIFSTRGSGVTREDRLAIRGNGNVGIGTIDPRATIHVLGTALIQGNSTGEAASNGVLRLVDDYNPNINSDRGVQVVDNREFVHLGLEPSADGNDGMLLWGDGTAQDFHFRHKNGATYTNLGYFDGQNLNMGIGRTSTDATVKLHVGGRVRIDDLQPGDLNRVAPDDEIVTADANGVLRKVPASTLFQTFEDDDWTISGANIYNKNAGNVGIGTTNPTFKFDVNAAMRLGVTNYFQFGGSVNNRLTVASDNDIVVTSNSRFKFMNRNATADLLVIDGGVGGVGIGTIAPSGIYGLDIATSARFRENVPLYFGNPNGGIRNYIYNLNDNDFRIRTQTLLNFRNRNDDNTIMSIHATNQRVGIMTDAATVELDVNGRARVRNLPAGVVGDLLVSTDLSGNLRQIPQSFFDGPWDRNTGAGGRSYLRNVTDKVGIGLIAPTNTLHIYEATGTSRGSSSGSILLEHGDAGGESSIVFKSRASNSDYGYINYRDDASTNGSTADNGLLEIGVQNNAAGNNQDDIAIMPSGRLGINTRGPQRMLHVEGDMRVTNLPTVANITDFAVTVDAAGDMRKQTLTSIKDNLGNHQMTQNLATNGFTLSNTGVNAGLKFSTLNSAMFSGRVQMGNIVPTWIDDNITGITNNGFAGNDGAIFAPVYTGSENSDLRLYILDNDTDAFSIWGNPCGTTDCGNINNSTQVARFQANGSIQFDNLATGGGARMVVADNIGRLSTQPIPVAAASTADNLGNHIATTNIRLNNNWLTNDGTGGDGLRVTDDGNILLRAQRTIAWSENIFGTTIAGDIEANGEGGNSDLKIRSNDDIVIEARGANGDFIVDANSDIELGLDNDFLVRIDGSGVNDRMRFLTRINQERVVFENNGDVRVNGLGGGGTRIVTVDNTGVLRTLSGSSTGLWDRDITNNETFLTNTADEVGIGTADPLTALHLTQAYATGNANAVEMRLQNRTNGGSSSLTFLENTGATTGMRLIYDGADDRLKFQDANNTDFMAIRRSGGDVGIGTINPQTQLHVVRNAAVGAAGPGLTNPARLRIQNEVAEGSAAIELMEGTGNIGNNNGMSLRYHSTADGTANGFEVVRGDASSTSAADIHLRLERNNGQMTVRNLATGGVDQMVVANNLGVLSTRSFDASLWNRAGSNTTLANLGDQVGIGTAAPAATLDVNGSVNVRSLGAGVVTDNFVVADPITGRLKILPPSTFTNYWAHAGVGELVLATASDRLGIGTTPASGVKFHVGTGDVRLDVLGGTGTRIVVADALGTLSTQDLTNFESYWRRDNVAGHVRLASNGDFVGIGVLAPAAKLHVNGKVRFNDLAVPGGNRQVMADANGELYTSAPTAQLWARDVTNQYTYAVNGGDKIGIGTSAPAQKLHIAGLNNTIRIEQMPVGNASSNVVVLDPNGDLRQVSASAFESPWVREVSNNEIFQKNLADYVGIGTNAPKTPLHISRALGTGVNNAVELTVQNTTNGGTAAIRFRDNASTNTFADNYNSMSLRWVGSTDNLEIANGSDSTFLRMRRQNGRIAIGYNLAAGFQPARQLYVQGDIEVEDGRGLYFAEPNSYIRDIGGVAGDDDLLVRAADILYLRGGNNSGLRINGDGTLVFDNVPKITTLSDDVLTFNGGNVRRIDMDTLIGPWRQTGTDVRLANNSWNVGIGLTTPSAKLDVNGDVRIRSLPVASPDLPNMVVADGSGRLFKQAIPTFTNYWARAGNVVSTATPGDLVRVGTIGTGVAVPLATSRLYVGGLMQASSLSGGGARMLVTDNTGTITAQTLPSSGFWSRTGNDLSLVNAGDDVGIGTAVPTARLHVNGTIRFESLAGGLVTDQLVTIDGSGSVRRITVAALEAATGLGNHLATQNIQLGTFWLSGDGGNEGVRVASDGRVSIAGTPLGANMLSVNGSAQIGTSTTYTRLLNGALTNTGRITTADFTMTTGASAGFVLRSDASGNATWVDPSLIVSDSRLKTDIAPFQGVLDGIGMLSPVTYKYKGGSNVGGQTLDSMTHYGFMAQDLASAFPHAVTEVNGVLQMRDRELTGILFAATHELRSQAIDLAARNSRLESEVAELRSANLELSRDVHSLSAETEELKKNMTTVLQHLEVGKRIQASEH